MKKMLSTREVAEFLGVNEKMVYSLIAEKNLPATKITGKWLFPLHLVEQWVENSAVNFPEKSVTSQMEMDLIIITGSNDLLLDQVISLFNSENSDQIAVFGNLGSLGGIHALRKGICHIATAHMLQDDNSEYNFELAGSELGLMPVIINFCQREQGILLQKGNPKKIESIKDLSNSGIKIANRPLGTGTRLLFDKELKKAKLNGEQIKGYQNEFSRHIEVGIEVLSGRADAAPSIRPVASQLGLDFIPLRWERYDFLINKSNFFNKAIQRFLSLLHKPEIKIIVNNFNGYDMSLSGNMIFQNN